MEKNSKQKMVNRGKKHAHQTHFSKELIEVFCEAVATSIDPGAKVAEELRKLYPDFPGYAAIKKWIYKNPEFQQEYRKAKMFQAELLIDGIIEISDGKDGSEVDRGKLKIETRKWPASCLVPAIYSTKSQNEVTVSIGHPDRLKEIQGLEK